jgi:hypothetical protein
MKLSFEITIKSRLVGAVFGGSCVVMRSQVEITVSVDKLLLITPVRKRRISSISFVFRFSIPPSLVGTFHAKIFQSKMDQRKTASIEKRRARMK